MWIWERFPKCGRCWKDVGYAGEMREMRERCERDDGEMWERCRRDVGEM